MTRDEAIAATIEWYGPIGGGSIHPSGFRTHMKPGLVVETQFTPPSTMTYRIIHNNLQHDLERLKQEILDSVHNLHMDVETVFEW